MKKKIQIVLFFLTIIFLGSCASRKDVIYFQHNKNALDSTYSINYFKVKPMDRLRINVSGPDETAIAPFKANASQSGGSGSVVNSILYTVEEDGSIVLPYLGRIKVQGMTRLEVVKTLREKLASYVKEPIVDVRMENFRVTILGNTTAQVIDFTMNDRPTILEAIAQSGDLKITARRNDILVIREEEGNRKSYRLDIRDSEIVNSPAYFLAQNDIIYVEPNTTGIQGNKSTWYLSLGMTLITVGLTVFNLFR
ncbi:polysaccharide biosynthesis/export family protein [Sphingobacterium siyangense]|uniref:polysaccharide biosynthesis/export family protein n=1 Tax=Sphingobacterium siyangense TaxID=459529 RepID=UPI003DA23C1A